MSDSSLSVDKERLDLTLPGRKETTPRLRVSCPKEQKPTTQGPTGQMRGNSSFTKIRVTAAMHKFLMMLKLIGYLQRMIGNQSIPRKLANKGKEMKFLSYISYVMSLSVFKNTVKQNKSEKDSMKLGMNTFRISS